MWFERFVIIVTSLSRDFLPSSWGYYTPDLRSTSLTFVGSFGLFFTLFLLFVRFLPMVAMAEVKGVMPQAHLDHAGHRGHGDYHGDIAARRLRWTMIGHQVPEAASRSRFYGYLVAFDKVDELLNGRADSARRWLHPLGRLHPVPRARARRRDGCRADRSALPRVLAAALPGPRPASCFSGGPTRSTIRS